MSTQFIYQTLALFADRELHLDGNSKISGNPPVPNALSLPAPLTCPGSTPTCRAACYASSAATSIPKDLAERYTDNLVAVQWALAHAIGVTARHLGDWIRHHCQQVGFRWHVSGDVFSADYAHWIALVCSWSPGVQHWIYTRSFQLAPLLRGVENLAVNLSADADNLAAARDCAASTGFRLTYLWRGEPLPTLPRGTVVFPGYGQRKRDGAPLPLAPHRAMICPGDYYSQRAGLVCGASCTKCGNPEHPRPAAVWP
jgi:hypothetical protein